MNASRLLISAALAVTCRATAAFADETRSVCVAVDSSAAPVVFAGDEIRLAVQEAGWPLSSDPSASAVAIVLAEPDGTGAPESFDVSVSKDSQRVAVRIRGKDARGVMYGGLDVAEQIALGQDPTAIATRQGAPYLPVRALKLNIPFSGNVYVSQEEQARGDWFFDLDYWRAFMRYLAYHRYNMLTFWSSHPYGRMVRLEKYPEACDLSAEELKRKIAFFHKLFGMARDHGLDTSVVTWNIHCSAGFQKAHGVKDGQDSELIRDYQKECVRELLVEYPELTGIGTCPGEQMGGTAEWRENWIRDTYLAGIVASKRTEVPFIHRYWGTEPAAAATMLAEAQYPGPVYLDLKFNGEHLYSSATPHLQEPRWLTQEPRPYKLLWHLRNDCIFQLRWADPGFAAALVRNCGGPDSAGFVIGSEVEVPGLDRIHTPETAKHKSWKYEFEKNWTRFGIWGRLGYNPGEPDSYWIAQFCRRFGSEAGPEAFAALQAASKIIPLTTSFHWNYMNGDWYPEGNIGGWNTSYELPFSNYRDNKLFHNVLEWVFTHTVDNTLQGIPDYVADSLCGVRPPANALTPPEVAEQLAAAARTCERLRRSAAGKVTSGEGEWECMVLDLRALEALGRYYSEKVRGATELMFFLATGEEARRASAIAYLQEALTSWKELAEITAAHYVPHEIFLFGQFDWQRYTLDAQKDIQLARELAPWRRDYQQWEWNAGKTSVTRNSWRVDEAAQRGLEKWAAAFNARVSSHLSRVVEQCAGGPEAATTLLLEQDGVGILAVRSSGVVSAQINGSDCRISGQAPNQFLIGPVRGGDNRVSLKFIGQVSSLPVVTQEAILDKDSIFLEAESGDVTAPLAVKELPGASGGQVLWAPLGKGRGADAAGKIIDNGWATYNLRIPTDGSYAIHACVWWQNTSANSFYYAWDSATPLLLGNDELFQAWHWIRTSPVQFSAGTHTLTIRNRDDGSVLDCLLVVPEASTSARSSQVNEMLTGYYERMSAPQHLSAKPLAEWHRRREEIKRQVLRDIGLDPMPDRLPLNTTYGGGLERGDYTLRRVYYQTWPAVYASGWLYQPKAPGKHPAVLNLHGHWEHGAIEPVVQRHCIALAKKGYIALAIDSVHVPVESFLIGASSIGLMTFNAMRGVDLLQTLPQVDQLRIGSTGASGGGQQTMYMMVVDDRVVAAVPAVIVSYFRRIMDPGGFPHCICNVAPAILRDVDEPEMCAVFAPRPALYLTVTGDWTKNFPKEEFPEIRSIYESYGAGDAVGCAQWEGGHDFSKPMRERMYAFFNHHFMGIDDPAAAAEPQIEPESLDALNALDKAPAGARGLDSVIEWYKSRFSFSPAVPNDAAGRKAYGQVLKERLRGLLGDVQVKGQLAQAPQPATIMGFAGLRLLVQSEQGIQVPALLLGLGQSSGVPVAVLIHNGGKTAILDEYRDVVKALLSRGTAVLIPEVRLTGELARTWPLDTVLWGRPEAGMAVTDLRACLDALARLDNVDRSRIALAGLGETAVTAIAAGALEPRFRAIAVERTGALYSEGRTAPLIANILRVCDIPQLAGTIAPRSVLLGAAKPADFACATEAYRGVAAASKLELRENALTATDVSSFLLHELGLD
jgi:dienelactone hydrolase